MVAPRMDEIDGLIKRGTFKIVKGNDIPVDATVLSGRLVLTTKSEHEKRKHKAPFVTGGHRDSMKQYIVHQSQNIQPSTIRLFLALAAANSLDLWTADDRQAYLQFNGSMTRPMCIKTVVLDFNLALTEALQLMTPLYGLSELEDF